ncbi:MAG: macro domain-containing protein [Coriobacteriales bacterium]
MPFLIVRGDVTAVRADAVVVPSNERLAIGGGVGAQVAALADAQALSAAAAAAAPCPAGSAVAVDPCGYPARCIVFATGPRWEGGGQPSTLALLQAANLAALEAAAARGCASIALPLISAGTFGVPAREAFACASAAVRAFLAVDAYADIEVTLALFEREAVCAGTALAGQIAELVDDAYVTQRLEEAERGRGGRWRRHLEEERALPSPTRSLIGKDARPFASSQRTGSAASRPAPFDEDEAPLCELAEDADALAPCMLGAAPADIDQLLDQLDEPFGEVLIQLIDARGMTDPQVYRAANMSRQTFSKIRNNPAMQPTKRSVLALAIALRLSTAETEALLARAGYAFSSASLADMIVRFHIEHGVYDIFDINEALFRYDQPLLGNTQA